MKTSTRVSKPSRFPLAKPDARFTQLKDNTALRRPMKTWQPSLDQRSKADDVYQRRHSHDVKAMRNSNYQTGSRFSIFADIHDENLMNCQNSTMRQVDDTKEINFNHLTDDTTTYTTNDKRLSIKKHVTQNSSSNPKSKKHATKTELQIFSPISHSNKKVEMFYVPLQFNKYDNHALLDTGAIQTAMSEAELRKITTAHPEAVLQELTATPEFQNTNSKREFSPSS